MQRTTNSQNRPLMARSRSTHLVLAAAAALAVAATPAFAQSTAAFTWQFQNGTTEAVLNSNTDTAVIEIYLTIDGTISGWSFFLDTSGTPEGTTQIAVSNVVTLEQASQTGSGPVNDIEDFECFAEVVDGTNSEGIPRLDPGTYLIETLTIQATGSISAASQATISFEPGQGLGYSAVADGATFYPRITTPTPLTIKWEESADDDQQTTDTDETTPDNTNNGGTSTSTDSTGQDGNSNTTTDDADDTANHDGATADENNDGDGTDDEIIDTNGDGGDNTDGSDDSNNDQTNTDNQNDDEPQDETVDANSNGNGNTSADDDANDDSLGDRDVPPEIAEFCGAGSVLLMLLNLVVLMTFKLGRAKTRARQGDGHNAS